MEIRKASTRGHQEEIAKYSIMPMDEMQLIQPCWACGSNAGLLLNKSLHPKNKEFAILLASTAALVDIAEFAEVDINILFTGEQLNDGRIARILSRWSDKGVIDPPTVYLHERPGGKLRFSDGRHRTKLTYFLGHKQIPVAIDLSELTRMKNILELTRL